MASPKKGHLISWNDLQGILASKTNGEYLTIEQINEAIEEVSTKAKGEGNTQKNNSDQTVLGNRKTRNLKR